METAKNLGIEEPCVSAVCKGLCCCCCYMLQIENEVMARQDLSWGCVKLEQRTGASPAANEMAR